MEIKELSLSFGIQEVFDDINLYRVVRDVMVENADSFRINKTLYCFN